MRVRDYCRFMFFGVSFNLNRNQRKNADGRAEVSMDIEVLRSLAREYAQIALSEKCSKRIERFCDLNEKKIVRPPVLVFEAPWGEIGKVECVCGDERCREMEWNLRAELFQFKHFEGDYAVSPYYKSDIALNNSGIGIESREKIIGSSTGSGISAHEYEDVLPDDDALDTLKMPVITIDEKKTEKDRALALEVFDGILPVRLGGQGLYLASWDRIARYHGVNNSLCDLYDRPEFIHRMMEKFTQIQESIIDRYEELNVLDGDALYLHCTPAVTRELPRKNTGVDKVTAKDVWVRAMAQIFAVVSPEMHEEFDLLYTKRLFDRCGLSYYGCCEPLDNKIDKLRQFGNLRRISISAWANVEAAAEKIDGDYVFSYKPNPAFVAGSSFDPEPVRREITRVLEACRKNNTPCEFILKDISTVNNDYTRLTKWVETANSVIDNYFA